MIITHTKERGWYLLGSKLQVKAMASVIQVDVLDSVTKQSTAKNWSPVISTECEEPPPVIGVENKGGFDSSNQCVDGWIALVRETLFSIPLVEHIFVSIEDDNVDVWVVIPQRDITVLDQLADIEWELLETFVSGEHPAFLMDFHVIYRCDRNIEDLAPTRAIRLPRQAQ